MQIISNLKMQIIFNTQWFFFLINNSSILNWTKTLLLLHKIMQLGPSFSSKSWSSCVFFLLLSLSLGPFLPLDLQEWGLGSTHITQLPWHLLGQLHIRGVWQRGEFRFPLIVPLFVDNLEEINIYLSIITASNSATSTFDKGSSAHSPRSRNSFICALPECKIHWNLQVRAEIPNEGF